MSGDPCPRPAKRIRDHKATNMARKDVCELCGSRWSPNVHHVYRRGQGGDDVVENLITLCGSGTTGCHGRVHARDEETLQAVGELIKTTRCDVLDYLEQKLGSEEAAEEFMLRAYLTEINSTEKGDYLGE